MKITVNATVDSRHGTFKASIEVPSIMENQFQPVGKCDDPFDALLFAGGVNDMQMKKVTVLRKDAADYLAKHLSRLIVESMESKDTINGYEK